jgi:hypothetical protein
MGGSPVAVALCVGDALEFCGVRYVVGGSLASSISGEPRSTLDVDIVVEMSEADVPRVVAALAPATFSHGPLQTPARSTPGANRD